MQLGRAAGCAVIAAVTGPGKAAACRRMGAALVIDLAGEPDPVARVRAETGGRGADVVIDVVGGETFGWARRCVAFEGRIVLVGFTGGAIGQVPADHVLLRNYSVLGLHLAVYRRENPALLRAVHDTLVRMCDGGADQPADLPRAAVRSGPGQAWTCWPGGKPSAASCCAAERRCAGWPRAGLTPG